MNPNIDSFYVTLPSNVKSQNNNKQSDFETALATKLRLDSSFKVALSEISYTRSWYNVPEGECLFLLVEGPTDHSKTIQINLKQPIAGGNYGTITDLLGHLNDSLGLLQIENNLTNCLLPKLVEITRLKRIVMWLGRLTIEKKEYLLSLKFSNNLREMLGFSDDKDVNPTIIDSCKAYFNQSDVETHKKHIVAKYPYELKGGFHSLFVYTDLIKPSIVGDTIAPLLRVVDVPESSVFSEQVSITYDQPMYFSLRNDEIDSIQVEIKDDSGNLVPFLFGRTILTLHFVKL